MLKRSIASVLAQTHTHLELIVVDDASDDGTQALVESYTDARLRYVRHNVRQGGAAARNTGIRYARGEYIAFLDSDDEWLPNKIELQLKSIGRASRRALVYGQVIRRDEFGDEVLPKRGIEKNVSVAEYLFEHGGLIQTSTLFMTTQLAREVRFDPALRKHQDWDFALRASQYDVEFVFVQEPLAIWYADHRIDRISRRVDWKASLDWLESRRSLFDERTWYKALVRVAAREARRAGNTKMAGKLLIEAASHGVFSGRQTLAVAMTAIAGRQSVDYIARKVRRLWRYYL